MAVLTYAQWSGHTDVTRTTGWRKEEHVLPTPLLRAPPATYSMGEERGWVFSSLACPHLLHHASPGPANVHWYIFPHTYPHIYDELLWGAKEDITQKNPSEAPPQWERMGSFRSSLPLTLCFSEVFSGSSASPKQPATINTIVCGSNWRAPSGGRHSFTPPPRETRRKPWLSAKDHNSSLTEQI